MGKRNLSPFSPLPLFLSTTAMKAIVVVTTIHASSKTNLIPRFSLAP